MAIRTLFQKIGNLAATRADNRLFHKRLHVHCFGVDFKVVVAQEIRKKSAVTRILVKTAL